MPDHSFTLSSHIARSLTLRRLELTAVSATLAAFVITAALVDTTPLQESNWIALEIVERLGWAWAGTVAIAFEASIFALYRRINHPTISLVGGAVIAVLGVADLAINMVRLAQVGVPPLLFEAVLERTAPAIVVTVAVLVKPAIPMDWLSMPDLPYRRLATVAVTLLVVTSTFGGAVVLVGTQPLADGQSGTASAAAGDKVWNSSTGDSIYSGPTISNGTVYVGSIDNSLYAFDAETGNQQWSAATGGSIYSSPTVWNGTVYVGSYDGSIYAFDAETGEQQWSSATGGNIFSSPTVSNGSVYIGSSDNSLYAFDADTGSKEWNTSTGATIYDSSPTVSNGSVYIGSSDNSLYAFDTETGNQQWSAATGDSIYSSPTVADGTVYVGSYDNSLYAFDAATGNQQWSSATGGRIYSSPTVADGMVYVGSYDNSLYAFDAATGNQQWSSTTGNTIKSSPTVAGGVVYVGSGDNSLYAFDTGTGNQQWSFATGDNIDSHPTVAGGTLYVGSQDSSLYALDTSHSKDSSGSRNELHTLGHVGPVEASSGSSNAPTLNGTVINQNGQPAANATVVGWGVDYSNISAGKAQSLEDRARELVQESSNVRPDAFDPELQLVGADGKLSKTSEPYVAVHTQSNWDLRGVDPGGGFTPTLGTDPQLGAPLVRAPANEKLVLTARDPTRTGLIQDGADGDLQGSTIPEATTLIVEQIGPSNSTIKEPLELETKPYAEIRSVANPGGKTHYAAKTELPTGFYRVSVENASFSYVIAVGDTTQMVQAIQADLNATANKYSNRAAEVRQKLDQGKFTRYKTTTNENGSFNFSTGSNVKTVAIQAYKTPPGMAEDPKNATLEGIRTYYATTEYNGSVVLPAGVTTVDVPSSNTTVHVQEYAAPNYPDLQAFENKTELFNQWLRNLTYSELPAQFQQLQTNVTRQQWQTSYETLRGLVEGRPAVEDRAQELLGENEQLFIDASEASTVELQQRTTVMRQAFVEAPNTVAAGDTSTSTTTDTISARFPFDTDLAPEDVMVTAEYPNGTSQVLNTSSEYVTVESNIGGDAVVIDEFPARSDGPGSVTFDVRVANADGIASARETVDNPAVSGSPPSIAGISLSTLRPGPDERVSMTLDGGAETTITNISQATVYAPDGSKLDTSITSARGIEFTTAGQGIHTLQVTFETSDGQTATVTERITAGSNPKAMPPGVRVSESPLGVYAVTGDGIDAGGVTIENGGSSVTVLAQLNETADVPSTLHVYTSGLSLPPESDLTVRVVKGADQQSVSKNVVVSVHLAQLDTGTATIYANGEPLPREGGNANGEVSTSASGTTIETLTDANGVLELSTDAAPGRIESLVYSLELSTGINVPGLVILPPLPASLPGWAPSASASLLLVAVPVAARRSAR